jgi:RNA polymerase-binding transcription factor DksA
MEALMLKRQTTPKSPRPRRCQFILEAAAADRVAVTGSFNNWSSDGEPLTRGRRGVWKATLLLPPGRHEYRFLVNGQWQDDPACTERVVNSFGTENCVVHVGPAVVLHETPSKQVSPMTKKQVEAYRKSLAALAAKLERGLAHDRRELMHMDEPDVPGGPIPATESVVDSGLVEVEVGMIANEEQLLGEVNAALARIEKDAFGLCESCGKAIARTRLDALPYARQCIRCAKSAQAAAA